MHTRTPLIPSALLAPQRPAAAVIRRRPPPHIVACFLARAVQGDASCSAIHAAGEELLRWTTTSAADPMLDDAMAAAIRLRDHAAELPEADRAPVVVAMLRNLLDDAPTRCAVDLDRALVRAARECRTTPTPAQRDHAARILALPAGSP